MANWIIRGRQLIALLTNESGGGVVEGDVVIMDDLDANSFTTTAVEGQTDECIGVALETIAAAAEGRICIGGEIAQVNLDGAANLRDWIKCDGVVKQATPQVAPGAGCFGQVLAAGATPGAIIWTHPLQGGGANTLDAAYDQGGAGAGRAITAANGQVDVSDDGIDIENIELYDTTELTIDGAGSITKTQDYHRVDTNSDDPTDNLDTIAGGSQPGELLAIRAENDARTVVVRHNIGNIWLIGEADVSLEDTEDHLWLIYDGTNWCSLGDGGGAGAPIDAEYVVTAADATLTAEVVVPQLGYYLPDSPPAAPGAFDDEFDNDVISGDWNVTGGFDAAFDLLQNTGNPHASESVFHGMILLQACTIDKTFNPSINQAFTVVVKTHQSYHSDVNESKFQVVITGQDANHVYDVRVGRFDGYDQIRVIFNNGGGAAQAALDLQSLVTPAYVMITHDGSKNFSCFFSTNGVVWSPIEKDRNINNMTSFTKLEIVENVDGDPDPMLAVEFVRYFTIEGQYKIGHDV